MPKLSQIAPAVAPLGPSDQIVAVIGGNADALATVNQLLGGGSSRFNIAAYGATTGAADNSTAIQAAITAAAAAGGVLYIPTGIWKYATTLAFTSAQPVPIIGDGKLQSVLVYTGTAEAINFTLPAVTADPRVTQNAAYSNGDGHYMRDFAVEPSVGGHGTIGIHIVTAADGVYNYFHWQTVRVGQFGTVSVSLDNSAAHLNCIANGNFFDCDFINSITATKIGDTVKFDNCRIDGTTVASFTQQPGAGSLILFECSNTTSGGMLFTNCNSNTTLAWCEHEIFVSSGYTGANNAMIKFASCVNVNVLYCVAGVISGSGSPTKPNHTLAFTGCQVIRYGGNTVFQGAVDVVSDDGTNTTFIDYGDNSYQNLPQVDTHASNVWSVKLNAPFGKSTAYNTNTATTAVTLTPQNITGAQSNVVLAMTGPMAVDANVQLPLLTNVLSLLGNINPYSAYKLRIINESANAHTWTVTTNTGWTLNGTMTIAQNTWRDFIITFTSTTAAILQNVGTGTFS